MAVIGSKSNLSPDVREHVNSYLEHARILARSANDSDRPEVRQAPRIHIYPPGEAPTYKPWLRRHRWALPWILAPTLGAIFTFAFGHSFSGLDAIQFSGSVTTIAQDDTSDAVYAVLDGHALVRLDFAHQDRTSAIKIDDAVSALAVRGRDGYYVSASSGKVGRVDLQNGHTLWSRFVGIGARSLAVAGKRVIVTSPARDTVEALATENGRVIVQRTFKGTPYDVALVDSWVCLSLARSNQVLVLNPTNLMPKSKLAVPEGPRELVTEGHRVWVRSTLAHVLQSIAVGPSTSAPGPRLLLSNQSALVSGNGGWLAIQGLEWVTVLSPDGKLHRMPFPDPSIISLLVQRDGSVIAGYESGTVARLAEK
jgi:hypothetical protein